MMLLGTSPGAFDHSSPDSTAHPASHRMAERQWLKLISDPAWEVHLSPSQRFEFPRVPASSRPDPAHNLPRSP
ncbi:hypothetical protein CTheo_1308 [Ceratobasidium theobromae]|uniref:Uncharacterized protein n=1 Tax=Ceratobasidium theobromae TaxID=1582974 RepID=A0A5N5QU11_9AGAM|nr:hypothetical protein CTheo_1308 [Ceratobasidium theobromae]